MRVSDMQLLILIQLKRKLRQMRLKERSEKNGKQERIVQVSPGQE